MAAQTVGCASDVPATESGDTVPSGDESVTEETEEIYDFGSLDMGGREFRFLNVTRNVSNFFNVIDVETMNGDILNDAVWERNSFIEEQYHVDIVEENTATVNDLVRTSVLAQEHLYDVAYCRTDTLGSLTLEGLLHNLNNGSGFRLDEAWWDQAIISGASVGEDKATYFLSSDMNLYAFDGTWCMYFNKRICEDLQLELPYAAVLDGSWTLDKLYEYIHIGANLYGDDSWNWNKDGSSVYGFASMSDSIMQMFTACGEKPIDLVDGEPVFKAGTDRFYQVAEKLTSIFGEKGTAHFGNDRSSGNHYELIYGSGRAFFTAAEIKGGNGGGVFSDMADDYGIIPLPKFDENQENYISPSALWGYFMTVPMTNPDLDGTSILLDAMSYLSYRDIVPDYYEVVLQIKHIRDEETVDMLDIIRSTRTYMTCYAYGWGKDMRTALTTMVMNGTDTSASIIASYKDSVEQEIESALETYRGNLG